MRNEYIRRNNRLKSLGFDSYPSYLSSTLWYSIRLRVLQRDHRICRCCKTSVATQVHHAVYDIPTLRGESIDKLYSVCEGCHHNAEFDGDRKTSLFEANQRLGFSKAKPPKPKKSGKKLSKAQKRAARKERERAERAAFLAQPEVVAARKELDQYRAGLSKRYYEAKLAGYICKKQREQPKQLTKAQRRRLNAETSLQKVHRIVEQEALQRAERLEKSRQSRDYAKKARYVPQPDVPCSNGLYDKLRQRTSN